MYVSEDPAAAAQIVARLIAAVVYVAGYGFSRAPSARGYMLFPVPQGRDCARILCPHAEHRPAPNR